jgi:predicted nucleic acid-binding protein
VKAYADTNLLARVYIEQMANADSDRLLDEVRTGLVEPLPVTWLLEIEFTAALELYVYFGRQGKEPRITPEQAAIAHADFDSDRRDGLIYQIADLTPARLVRQATTLARRHTAKHGHRTYDLIHVGSALELGCSAFWTFDRRAAQLAEREGLKVPPRLKSAMKKLR